MKDVREPSYTLTTSQPLEVMMWFSSAARPEAPERLEGHRRDEEASSRMGEEGCPNDGTARRQDTPELTAGYTLVGRPNFLVEHPLRTLLYELFVEPFLRLLQRALGGKVHALSTKTAVRTAPRKTTGYQRASPTQRPTAGTSCCAM